MPPNCIGRRATMCTPAAPGRVRVPEDGVQRPDHEERRAGTPWRYFSDHQEPDLARAVSEGRRREFAGHGWASEDVPDPQDPETHRASVLSWSELGEPGRRELYAWYRALIALRRAEPELTDPRLTEVAVEYGESWLMIHRGSLGIAANLGTDPLPLPEGDVVLACSTEAEEARLPGESSATLRVLR
ncbi:DUF3459 domain-containing protein [Actinoallomurus spadix]